MPIRAITFDFWRTLYRDPRNDERKRLRVDALVAETGVLRDDAEAAMEEVHRRFLRTHISDQRTLQPVDALPMLEEHLSIRIDSAMGSKLAEAFATAILDCPPMPIDGALEAVAAAAERFPAGLISDTGISPGSSLQKLLKSHGFLDHLRALTFSDVVGVSKPKPAMYERAAQALGVRPEELFHLGDLEPTDIRGALDIGATAGLFGGDNTRFVGATEAHYTFTSWSAFVEQLPGIA